jgi:hypothetical protein
MIDPVDQLLERAASDAHKSVRPTSTPQSSQIARRARRRKAVLATTSVLVISLLATGTLLIIQPEGEVAGAEDDTLITSEMILEDGIVTEDEYRAGAEAVVACLDAAGIEAHVSYDGDFSALGGPTGYASPGGHAEFWFPNDGPSDPGGFQLGSGGCGDLHLSHNVLLGWSVALGHLDLDELREEETATTACVEERTSQDFGELTYDQFGYLTEQGQRTRDAAFEYQDHEPWDRCRNDLGYQEKYEAETRALLECVETRSGQDFGQLDFDDTGQLTAEGQQTLQAAISYEDHEEWEACQTELGVLG